MLKEIVNSFDGRYQLKYRNQVLPVGVKEALPVQLKDIGAVRES